MRANHYFVLEIIIQMSIFINSEKLCQLKNFINSILGSLGV
jgi:hypothetical protein